MLYLVDRAMLVDKQTRENRKGVENDGEKCALLSEKNETALKSDHCFT